MLNFKEKVEVFTEILNRKEMSYSDSFNGDILICSQNFDFKFLKQLKLEKDIKNWTQKLKSRIVMREDDDLLEEIINDYILCG